MMKRARENLDLLDASDGFPLGGPFPFSPPLADEDDDDGPYETPFTSFDFHRDEKGGGRGAFSPADPPEKVFAEFVRVCRAMGVDPREVLDQAADGPFRFRTNDAPSPRRKKGR